MTVSDQDASVMGLEQRFPRPSAKKDAAILAEMGFRSARYYQLLARAVVKQEVIAAFPVEAGRVQRGIRARKTARAARTADVSKP